MGSRSVIERTLTAAYRESNALSVGNTRARHHGRRCAPRRSALRFPPPSLTEKVVLT